MKAPETGRGRWKGGRTGNDAALSMSEFG
jgi:hypothetical protein